MKHPLILSLLLTPLLFGATLWWRPKQRESPDAAKQPLALKAARQLIIVTTDDWNVVSGELRRYERSNLDQPWQVIGAAIPIVVGRNGMAWGRGLHGAPPGPGPIKHEGDGKSPAGVFRLSAAFGYAPPTEAKNIKLPYTQSTAMIECVDDAESIHYNRVLERTQTTSVDWKSSEQMLRRDDLYRWVVVVDHNANSPVAGGGSCIFLHIWSGPSQGTAGCTAAEAKHIEELLTWLDPAAQPLLVQLPKRELTRLRISWELPAQKME